MDDAWLAMLTALFSFSNTVLLVAVKIVQSRNAKKQIAMHMENQAIQAATSAEVADMKSRMEELHK